MFNNQRRSHGMGVYLLAYHILGVIGLDHIPPVTLVTVIFLMAIYIRAIALPWETIDDVCISSHLLFKHGEWKRLFYGALEHGDDFHLYYNMMSFIMKGQRLEKHFGTPKFLYILLVFTPLTSLTLCTLCYFAGVTIDDSFSRQCAVGFSGVIFALKVLTTHHYPHSANSLYGIPVVVPANWVVWLELILIQLITPNASFFGHLAGILVGLAYVKGPLKFIMHDMFSIAVSYLTIQGQNQGHRLRGGGMATQRASHFQNGNNFPRGMSEDEQIWQATQASLLDNYQNNYGTTRMSSTNNDNYLPHLYQQSNSNTRQRTYEEFYSSGLSEEEQLRLATESSLRENFNYSRTNPSAPQLDNEFYYSGQLRPPPPGFHSSHLYPDLSTIRSRRIQHFTQ